MPRNKDTLAAIASMLASGPILGLVGFGPGGIAAGSLAALIHSSIGNVAARSLFAILQSAGAGGYGFWIVKAIAATLGLTVRALYDFFRLDDDDDDDNDDPVME